MWEKIMELNEKIMNLNQKTMDLNEETMDLNVKKRVAIIGLGLIGGSIAKAIKQNTDYHVYGFDIQDSVVKKALLVEAVDDILTDEALTACDLTIVALYPGDTIAYIQEKAPLFKKASIVLDCGGVKEIICKAVEPIARKHDFIFIGGHPMAGLEHSGFAYAKKALFNQASMVFTPAQGTPIEVMDEIKKLFCRLGFTNIQISTPKEHDQVIAFTSQLAHVVSSAYIKSPSALQHKGFSAGSYKDLTRVAKLNEVMWTELFLDNATSLTEEIDGIIERLKAYRTAIDQNDAATLQELLKDGRERKAIIDGEHF